MVKDLYYDAKHYNLKYKAGALLNRIIAHDVCGIKPADIEWIWIVEEKRNATPEEIRKLCKGGVRVVEVTHRRWSDERQFCYEETATLSSQSKRNKAVRS